MKRMKLRSVAPAPSLLNVQKCHQIRIFSPESDMCAFIYLHLCLCACLALLRNLYISLENYVLKLKCPESGAYSDKVRGRMEGIQDFFFEGGGCSIIIVWGKKSSIK